MVMGRGLGDWLPSQLTPWPGFGFAAAVCAGWHLEAPEGKKKLAGGDQVHRQPCSPHQPYLPHSPSGYPAYGSDSQ